jgi:beta-galactosidase
VVRFSVSGGGIVALDNGNLQDHEPYQSTNRRAFNGQGLAIIRPVRPGTIRVTATANGLRDATLTIVGR